MKNFKFKNLLTLPALLNIGGIGIAIAAFYIMFTIANYHITFDQGIKDHDRIYMMTHDKESPSGTICRPVAEKIVSEIPIIETYGCIHAIYQDSYYKKVNGEWSPILLPTVLCSNGFVETFGFNIIEGNIANFVNPNHLIISRAAAKTFELNVGDIVSQDVEGKNTLEIVAIYDDLPRNYEFGYTLGFVGIGDRDIDSYRNFNEAYFIKVKEGTENCKSIMEEGAKPTLREYFARGEDEGYDSESDVEEFGFSVVALDDIHLGNNIKSGFTTSTDKNMVYTLLLLAIVVVIIAYINYFNFFLARVPERLRSVNTRKILGCSRGSLIWSLIAESLIHTLVAIVAAYIIIGALSVFVLNSITDVTLLTYAANPKSVILTIGIALVAAVVSSIYPAIFITSVPPALAIKGTISHRNNNVLRYVLIGFQITASIALIIGTLFIRYNNDYILNHDLGFKTESILSTYTPTAIAAKSETVRDRLLKNPDILDIAWAAGDLVSRGRMGWERNHPRNPDEDICLSCTPVSWNFLQFIGLKIEEGRDFNPSDEESENGVFIFNQAAKRKFDLLLSDKIIGHSDDPAEIAGFCEDFNFKPLQYGIDPFAFYVFGKHQWNAPNHLYVKIAPNAKMTDICKFIGEQLHEIDPNYDILGQNIITFNTEIARNYTEELRLSKEITLFTIMLIIIAIMGIFGIVLFETKYRRKEIGIRKVNGATIMEILGMFNRKFVILVGACFAIATPLSYIFIQGYFSTFTYHCPIYWWVFAIALITTLIVTTLVVSAASLRAANENPVNTLKTE